MVPTGKGKINFLQWNLTGHSEHASGQAPYPGVDAQEKMNSVTFLFHFVFFWHVLSFACLFFICIFSLFFFCVFLDFFLGFVFEMGGIESGG